MQKPRPTYLRLLLVALLCAMPFVNMDAQTSDNKGAKSSDELHVVRRVVRGFSRIDTNYIEPQHYNFTVMAQLTNTYDIYTLTSNNGHEFTLSPDVRVKAGPYFGWRWFFLGYTFDLRSLGIGGGSSKKTEIDFSIYSSQIGVDLYYRRTGNDYKIRNINLGNNIDVSRLNGMDFDGAKVGITGFNLYYIFNSKRFSYPAAFAQSTVQKRSQGSWMLGLGYLHNTLDFDYEKLNTMVEEHSVPSVSLDSSLTFDNVKHSDFYVSGGYGYNWVFARNCLFAASFSLALAYKHSSGDVIQKRLEDFSTDNLHLDGIWRFGLVYNNNRWYTGASAIVRTYNYSNERFEANNTFGSVNFYVGYNFGLKSRYKKKK